MITIPGAIPISIHPLFWLVAFFIGWMWTFSMTGALLSVLVIVVSVLFHEFGHALTAKAFGQKTRIELAAFGGFTYREGRKLKLWEEFFVVLNGPIAGFILFGVAYLAYNFATIEQPTLLFIVKFTFVANLFWTIINLIPVLPLDGGHILSIILESIFGFKGVKMAIVVGLVIAVAISAVFFALGMFLVGALFLILTFESFRSLRYYKIFSEKDRDTELQKLIQSAINDHQQGNTESAIAKLQDVRFKTKAGILHIMATQELAAIYREQKRFKEAYELLVPIQKTLSGEHLALFHYLAFVNDDYPIVTELASKCFQDNPTYDTALINALAYAALSKAEPAVGWLECAVREGLPNPKDVLKRREFDPIRPDPKFQAFVNSR